MADSVPDPLDTAGRAGSSDEGMGVPADALSAIDSDLASAQATIDELLKQANFEDPGEITGGDLGSVGGGIGGSLGGGNSSGFVKPNTQQFDLPSFSPAMRDGEGSSIDLLRDVELNVKIELGRSRMFVEDVLKLAEGSVVELDKLAGDPVDVFVNDRLVARGEVLVLNDNFCVRVNEIISAPADEGD